jgi:hypothetical protein
MVGTVDGGRPKVEGLGAFGLSIPGQDLRGWFWGFGLGIVLVLGGRFRDRDCLRGDHLGTMGYH